MNNYQFTDIYTLYFISQILTSPLFRLFALCAKDGETIDKLLEINTAAAVRVKDGHQSLGQRVTGNLGNGQELFLVNEAVPVLV